MTDDTCVTQPSSGYCCELDRPASDVFLDFTFESTDAADTSFTVSRPFSQMVQSCGDGNYFYPTVRRCLICRLLWKCCKCTMTTDMHVCLFIYFCFFQIGTGLGINILGDAFMKNMLVEFDRENGRVRCGSRNVWSVRGVTVLPSV